MNKFYSRDLVRVQLKCVLHDSYTGFMSFAHSSLTLFGLTALLVMTLLMTQPELRLSLQRLAMLENREQDSTPNINDNGAINKLVDTVRNYAAQTTTLLGLNEVKGDTESSTSDIATAIGEVKSPVLTKQQKAVARYLSNKYHVNPTAVSLMVVAAQETGKEIGLEPSLLLAVMAVESGFNPFAESTVGAQGLMQVMSKVHSDKLDDFGGANAALNPVANLQVGAVILKDCIRRGGSLQAGLGLYLGVGMGDDGGYANKVMQVKQRIDLAARGGNPDLINTPNITAANAVINAKPSQAIATPVSVENLKRPVSTENDPHAEVQLDPKA